ncbi:hypothetical protein ACGFZ3_02410 [Stenotrophomonas sp. NPDC047960]|uniref:hypothetical protein n=1 Tax=Stenotrophomonas sp. NPDC047960 TaxID=3364531 RepID=UPI00371ED3A0
MRTPFLPSISPCLRRMASRESVTHMPALIDGVMFQAVFRFIQSLDVIQICDAEPFCPAMDAAMLCRLRQQWRRQVVCPARTVHATGRTPKLADKDHSSRPIYTV